MSTKTIKYTGPSVAVEVEPLDGSKPFTAERDEPVEVTKECADSLLRQPTWEEVVKPSPKPKSKKDDA